MYSAIYFSRIEPNPNKPPKIPPSQFVRRKSLMRSTTGHAKQNSFHTLIRSKTLDGYKFVTFNLNHTYHPIDMELSQMSHKILPNPMNFITCIKQKRAKLKKSNAQHISFDGIIKHDSCRSNNTHEVSQISTESDNFSFTDNNFVSKAREKLLNRFEDCKNTNTMPKNNYNNNVVKQVDELKQKLIDNDCENEKFLCSVDKSCNASYSLNNASLDGSDYSGYQNYRTPRNTRERDQDLRDPIEPLDSHHSYHHSNPNHHFDHHHHHHHHHREESVKRRQFTRSLSNTEPPTDEKTGKYSTNVIITGYRGYLASALL